MTPFNHTSLRSAAEPLFIAGLVVATLIVRKFLPAQLHPGELVLACFSLLLAQGLIRDIAMVRPPRLKDSEAPGKVRETKRSLLPRFGFLPRMKCLCAESIVGAAGILCGIVLLVILPIRTLVSLPTYTWPVAVFVMGSLGLTLKSLVVDWTSCRIRRETDHHRTIAF